MRAAVNLAGGASIRPDFASTPQSGDADAPRELRFHVVVHGSRGDVTLALAVLYAR